MAARSRLCVWTLATLVASGDAYGAAVGASLAGEWEIQGFGADRTVRIEQQGARIIAHRTLWPEFEGEKYKLEHLYRGTLTGTEIKGELLVKEPELKDFEVLRAFAARVASTDSLTFDDLPLKRVSAAASAAPVPPANAPPPQAQLSAVPAPSEDSGSNLFSSIMGAPGSESLFHVSSRIAIADRAGELTVEGDRLLAAGKADAALGKFEQAAAEGATQATLAARMGRCHLALGHGAKARELLRRALKLDPSNAALRADYRRATQL